MQAPDRRFLAQAALTSGLGLLASLVMGPSLLQPAQAAAPTYRSRVLVGGLANPRGLLVDGGRVLVTESGAGGPRQSGGSNCMVSGAATELCAGASGAIGAWDGLTQTYSRLITGLPSLAQANGTEGTGIADLTAGGPSGLLGVFGLGGDPRQATLANLSPLFGQVVSINLGTGALTARSNLAAYERTNDPDGGGPSSNPYGVQSFAGRLYATDAGGNTLLTLDPTPDPGDGTFPILSAFVFPNVPVNPGPGFPGLPNPFPASPVPTGLTVNTVSDRLLIGELTGFPFAPGAASVYAQAAIGSPAVSLSGFSFITDVAAGADGSVYVLNYASNFFNPANTGSIWRVLPNGSRDEIVTGLTEPTGLAVDGDGVLYVTNQTNGLQGELREYRPNVPGPLPVLAGFAAWGQSRRLRRRPVKVAAAPASRRAEWTPRLCGP